MMHASTTLSFRPRLIPGLAASAALALVLALSAVSARADDYGDVNQLLKTGKYSEALNKADLYLANKPRDPQMRFLKGVILTDLGRPADATAVLLALTQEYPELPEPHNNLAALYAQQGQYDKARGSLEMAVRINPGYAIAHENLGDVYARLAGQSYARALQLDGASTSANAKLTQVRAMLSPPATATRR